VSTDNIPDEVIEAAYEHVDNLLRKAVDAAADRKEFFNQMVFCQIMASHMLAVLTFNAYIQDKEVKKTNKPLSDYYNQTVAGVRKELTHIATQFEAGHMEEVKAAFATASTEEN
jgi:hypothetical protein